MEVLITGGAGFIGSHLGERLLAEGHKVSCLDNLNDYYSPKVKLANIAPLRKNPNFRFYMIDIGNAEGLENCLGEVSPEVIVHLAARAGVRPSIENPNLYVRENVLGTTNLLEACRKIGINNFIFASSSSVYGNCSQVPFREDMNTDHAISPYAATKKAGEVLCHTYHHVYGLDITALRFFTAFGPRNRPDMAAYKFTDAISRSKPIEMYGDGSTSRDYTYIDDIVGGIIRAIRFNKGFEVYNLGSSSPVKLRDFIATIEGAIGRKAKIVEKPIPPGDVERTFADVSKAKSLLGWEPTTALEDGVKKLVRWYEEERID